MQVSLRQIAEAIETLAPPGLAESWDRSGLQVGDPEQTVTRAMVTLDPSLAAVAEARRAGAELLITHHPLLLQPLERIDLSSPPGAVVAELVRNGIALYAAHTNLDRAEGGVNDALAGLLHLTDVAPLGPGEAQVKVVVTVPVGYEGPVAEALFAAGAGRVGAYSRCSFAGRGAGTFFPGEGAAPFLGAVGRAERVAESRLEVLAPRTRLAAVRRALGEAHPYERPAVDVYDLGDAAATGALGRLGRLPESRPLGPWAAEVGRSLGASGVRWVGAADTLVRQVAVCGGSGAELWRLARSSGADVLVTGDLKYHTALDAVAAGFAVVDVGHGPSEACALPVLHDWLAGWVAERGAQLELVAFREPDPFHWNMP
ncbi:MAG: Nif3-like dinuclear metal center hexameric protein [Deferrisomatales bacterium]|nr:Nif3-like dinuclear metal center hexameric protein [Deferrisomatales bacterium]